MNQVLPSNLARFSGHKQVETACPDAYHAFLKQANISSLATMT
jgi:hypothetical protein